MKSFIILLVLAVSISSCSTSNKIITVEDPYKNTSSIKLQQILKAYSDDIKGGTNDHVDYWINAEYIFEEGNAKKPELLMTLQMVTGIKSSPFDSLVFLNIDFEIFKLNAQKNEKKEFVESTSTSSTIVTQPVTTKKETSNTAPILQTTNTVSNSTSQLLSTTVSIPVNLWEPLANSKTLFYRAYLGKEGIDIKIDGKELLKLKSLMQMVLERNKKANVLPEGLKKW